MAIDIFSTHALLAAIETMLPATTFLRDRYFPTGAGDIFATNDVLIEYREGTKKIAPHVTRNSDGMIIERTGFKARKYEPPMIAPKRTITVDDLYYKGFGEALYSELTPQQREASLITRDLQELDESITRTEEAMCAEVMTTNALEVTVHADENDAGEKQTIHFYDGSSNSATYTPTTSWGAAGAKILEDLYAMYNQMAQKGLPATDIIIGANVASALINNSVIRDLLDNRRYELGGIKPEDMPQGAFLLGTLNAYGPQFNVISYPMTYAKLDGTSAKYIGDNDLIMTAPGAGRMLYGRVDQVEPSDGMIHSYAKKRVPLFETVRQTRELALRSCPLPVVNAQNCFLKSTVVFS